DLLERCIDNRDLCAATDGVVELDDVARTHANATVARWFADVSLLGCTVNVNVAPIGVRVLRFQTPQPEDPRYDRIASRCIGRKDFTRRFSVFKNFSARSRTTDF